MAVGWVGDDGVSKQISDSLDDEITKARLALPSGESLAECEDCGEAIDERRRKALPGVRRCQACQSALEKATKAASLFNRRAGKDSQLK
jgi:phage/conjugal plasmid C-4 type zinc finger TraR family protein